MATAKMKVRLANTGDVALDSVLYYIDMLQKSGLPRGQTIDNVSFSATAGIEIYDKAVGQSPDSNGPKSRITFRTMGIPVGGSVEVRFEDNNAESGVQVKAIVPEPQAQYIDNTSVTVYTFG